MKKAVCFLWIFLLIFMIACAKENDNLNSKSEIVTPNPYESVDELYEKALTEDVLIVYTVSTRITKVKEAFEKEYPGLFVEVRDLRSPDLIRAVKEDYEEQKNECDVVLCNDNSGDFKQALVDTQIVIGYIPEDIAVNMKDGFVSNTVTFVDEAELLFYSNQVFSDCPIENLWELTEEQYKGKIYIPNPLRSFSTYAFCSSFFAKEDQLKRAYEAYAGEPLSIPAKESAASIFWKKLCDNVVFTNSSDEVCDALSTGVAYFGVMVSSKLRLNDIGYDFSPIYHLNPFCGSRSSFSVMLAKNSSNVNTAKLFIRFLLGEADGTGEGYEPFHTVGTWSCRKDITDGTDISLEEIDIITPDQDDLIKNRETYNAFWEDLLIQYSSR